MLRRLEGENLAPSHTNYGPGSRSSFPGRATVSCSSTLRSEPERGLATRCRIVSLDDAPTSDEQQREVTDRANAMFDTHHNTTYVDTMSYYGHLVSSIGWIAHRCGPIL